MPPLRHRVLVAGGEDVGTLAAVRALRAAGYVPWLAVSNPTMSYAARSRAIEGIVRTPAPWSQPGQFVDAVAHAATRLDVAAVLPTTDPALIAVSTHADAFPDTIAVGGHAPAALDRALDKRLLPALSASAGLPAIPTCIVTDGDAGTADIALPAVVKPVRSVTLQRNGGLWYAKTRRVEDTAALRAAIETLPGRQAVVQPYLAGAVTAVCGVADRGTLVAAVHQVAHRTTRSTAASW